MQSNSKIGAAQKQELKEFKAFNTDVRFVSVPQFGVTFAYAKTGPNGGVFSVALASGNEKKVWRKVGEFHASRRFSFGEVLPVNGPFERIDRWSIASGLNAENERGSAGYQLVFIDGVEQTIYAYD